LRIRVPVLTGQPATVSGWQEAFDPEHLPGEIHVEGLGEWRDPGYWSCRDGDIRFRAHRPGPQEPRFSVTLGERTEKFLFQCNVRLSAVAVEFRWKDLDRVRNEMRVPFEASVPDGFTPPFVIETSPEKALVVAAPSRGRRLPNRINGYLVCEELRPTDRRLTLRLRDATGAEAATVMDIPDECECIAPPPRIRAVVKRFKNTADLLAESSRILQAPDKPAILASEDGKNFVILSAWIGGLEECPTISDRVRRLFADQSALYRRIRAGEPEPPGEAERLLAILNRLSSGDIEEEFLEGYYGQ
jgi:hypothetical protein